MAKIAKVTNTRWETIDGVLCAVLVTRDKVRGERSFAVPAGAFLLLSGEARRRIAAANAKGQSVPLPPPWHHVNFIPVQTMNPGTTDNKKVGVIFDRGLDTEFGLSIEPEYARQLGHHLIAEADKIPSGSQTPKVN